MKDSGEAAKAWRKKVLSWAPVPSSGFKFKFVAFMFNPLQLTGEYEC